MIHLSIINDINMLIVYLRYIRFGNTFYRILRRDDPFYAWAIIFINPLDSVFFSGYFLNVPHRWPRRSDGPGANVNLRNLWLNSVLNAVLRVSIVSLRMF